MLVPIPVEVDAVAKQVVDGAYRVHRAMGPGLLESVYEACMCCELSRRNLTFEKQLDVPIVYEGVRLESGLRLDLLVAGLVVVELKSIEQLLPIHEAQLLTYLKLTGKRLGLLINFNLTLIKDGIKRIAL